MKHALESAQRRTLLGVARRSITFGLAHGLPLVVDPTQFEPVLRCHAACFVTLTLEGALRGCIGSLQASRALCVDVAGNAYAAAFRDHRFAAVGQDELDRLSIEISVLTTPQRMNVSSEADLLALLEVGRDGLILQDGATRATFLPSVWKHFADPAAFVAALRRKAGLPTGYWASDTRAFRYHTLIFSELQQRS